MKLLSLNIWGGKLKDQLLTFISAHQEIDVFCFQEVYSSSAGKIISREMHSDIFEQITSALKDHIGYFAPHLKNHDLEGKVDHNLETGLAVFVKKSLSIKERGDIFIHRSGHALLDDNYETIPRNLQYVVVTDNNANYLIGHFHGVWYPKTKLDTEDRIEQSKKIRGFLAKRKEKIILCGDFNLLPNTQSLSILEENMRNLIKEFNISTTRNLHYKRGEKYADYILISPEVSIRDFRLLEDEVSDHLPLYLEFESSQGTTNSEADNMGVNSV